MHAQQLPAHAAPPVPMMPHPGLAAPPGSAAAAASLLGLGALGAAAGAAGAGGAPGGGAGAGPQHPLSMLAKPELHRADEKPNVGK